MIEKLKVYEVQTLLANGKWENVWNEDDQPQYFLTKEEAEFEIDDFIYSYLYDSPASKILNPPPKKDEFRVAETEIEIDKEHIKDCIDDALTSQLSFYGTYEMARDMSLTCLEARWAKQHIGIHAVVVERP